MKDHRQRHFLLGTIPALVVTFIVFVAPAFSYFMQVEQEEKQKNPVVIIKTNHGEIHVELFEKDAPETVENFIGLAEGKKEFTDPETGEKTKRPFYDGLIFHRVIKNFMIQGGCPKGNGTGGPGYTFKDEINATELGLDKMKVLDENNQPHRWLGVRSQEDFIRMVIAPLQRKMNIDSQKELDERSEEFKEKLDELTLKESYENMGYSYDGKLKSHHPKKGVIAMANSGPNTNGSQFFINLIDTPWLAGKHTVFGRVIKGMDVVEEIGEIDVDPQAKPRKKVEIISIRLSK